MKRAQLENEFLHFAKSQKLKIGEQSHFEGEKYTIAKPFTVSLKNADSRCGNRIAIILHLPGGCVHPLTSFHTPLMLSRYMSAREENLSKEVARYKKMKH